MKTEITAQQTAFFTRNGYLELEGISFQSEQIFQSAMHGLSSRLIDKEEKLPPEKLYLKGRDLWREEPILKHFLAQKIFPTASILSRQKRLRIGADQWIPASYPWRKSCCLKDLFSIQGLILGALISFKESNHAPNPHLGLIPLPLKPNHILFFQPQLILNWPDLPESCATDIYLMAYTLPGAIYIQNEKDPLTNELKHLGYGFGDPLKNEFHPLLI